MVLGNDGRDSLRSPRTELGQAQRYFVGNQGAGKASTAKVVSEENCHVSCSSPPPKRKIAGRSPGTTQSVVAENRTKTASFAELLL